MVHTRENRSGVYERLQFLPWLEIGYSLCRHEHLFSRFRVSALSGSPLPKAKTAEAPELDFFSGIQRIDNTVKNCLDYHLSIFFVQVGISGHLVDKFSFRHSRPLSPNRLLSSTGSAHLRQSLLWKSDPLRPRNSKCLQLPPDQAQAEP